MNVFWYHLTWVVLDIGLLSMLRGLLPLDQWDLAEDCKISVVC